MSKSGDNSNDGNNPGAGQAGGNPMPNGDQATLQTTQPLLLDQTSLEAIICGVSSRIMSQHRSDQPSTGRNAPPSGSTTLSTTQHKQQRQPGDTPAGEFTECYDKHNVIKHLPCSLSAQRVCNTDRATFAHAQAAHACTI